MSILITLEGGDGSGKSTQSRLLSTALLGIGYNVTSLREPGGTNLGENLREIPVSYTHLTLPTSDLV